MSTNTYKGCLRINMAAGCVSGARVFTLCMNCMKAPREPAASMRLFFFCYWTKRSERCTTPSPPPSVLQRSHPYWDTIIRDSPVPASLRASFSSWFPTLQRGFRDHLWRHLMWDGSSLAALSPCGPRLFWSTFCPQWDSVRATMSPTLIGGDAHPFSLVLWLN